MIKKMLWPLIKRFKGLFISMVFVGMLAFGLLMAFTNTYINLNNTYPHYFNEYGAPTVTVETDFHDVSGELEYMKKIDGVNDAETRITLDCYLKRSDGRQITSRIHTTKPNATVNKLFIQKTTDQIAEDDLWVSVESAFANNNGFKPGDTIGLGAFGMFLDVKIKNIVESPETIYVRVKDYIWSDNKDFGFVYFEPLQAKGFIKSLNSLINEKAKTDIDFQKFVDDILEKASVYFPDYKEYLSDEKINEFIDCYGNELLIVGDGKDNAKIEDIVKAYLDGRGVNVKDSHIREKTTSYMYMKSAASQIKIAAIFLPVFFYLITLFVIILFINQMVKQMTSDIGIMMSIGIRGVEITALFSIFIFIISILSSILGFGFSYILGILLRKSMIGVYHIPYLLGGVSVPLLIGGTMSLVIIGQLAVVIASKMILRITPKDAMVSNETKRKKLPKWLDKAIDKSPTTLRLGINSVAQNFRRFFVSCFSIFAALTMTMITMMFVDSKNELLDQTLNRRLSFDCQVYMSEKADQAYLDDLKLQSFVEDASNGYFTYLEVTNKDGKSLMIQTVALADDTPKDMLFIPDKTGKKDIEITGEGVILDKVSAERLGVKVGDTVNINKRSVVIDAISYQYFNITMYTKMSTLKELTDTYASTLFINTTDEIALLNYLSEKGTNTLTVFSSSLKKDLSGRLAPVNLFAYILVAFSIGMGLIILSIMTQNALLEQQRSLSVLRAIGFRTIEISNMWMVQSLLQLLISNIFAVPTALLTANLLFNSASSATQKYPFVFNPISISLCFAFILLVIGIAHLIAMLTISKWNLADNTRSRE